MVAVLPKARKQPERLSWDIHIVQFRFLLFILELLCKHMYNPGLDLEINESRSHASCITTGKLFQFRHHCESHRPVANFKNTKLVRTDVMEEDD